MLLSVQFPFGKLGRLGVRCPSEGAWTDRIGTSARRRDVRRSRTALIAAVVLIALSASIIRSQKLLGQSALPPRSAPAIDPSRGARHLLRNGLDYLNTYQDYDRALIYLREAE